MPRGDVSTFITPKTYGRVLAKSWAPVDLPIPTDAWMERRDRNEPKSHDALHLDSVTAIAYRKVYGYLGHIQKLKKSENTDSPWLLTIAIKLALPQDKDATLFGNLSICFARIGAFASKWAPKARNPEPSNFVLGDMIEGIAPAPSSRKYRFANLARRGRASMKERKAFPKLTRFRTVHSHLDSYFPTRI